MKIYSLAHNLKMVDAAPPISGFEKFIGVYVLMSRKVALIDVGPSSSIENLMSGLRELDIDLADISHILATHIHIDHAGGISKLLKQLPNAMVVVHEKGEPHLVNPARLWEDTQRALGELALEYGPIEPVPRDRILAAREGTLLDLGETEIEVLSTPGHVSHHLSFLDRKERRLFTGDAAGVYIDDIDLIRPATPFPFNFEQALNSLDKLIGYNPTTVCYAHFGAATPALDKLNYYKQQLLLWGNIIANYPDKTADWQDIYNEIRKRDKALARIDRLPPDQQQRELSFIRHSIEGFIGYFQKFGTDYIKKA